MSVRSSAIALALLTALSASQADTLLIPPDLPETSGLNTGLRNAARTYMALYMPVNFTAVNEPLLITGMQLRITSNSVSSLPGATWPSVPLSFTNFNVQLSQASSGLLSDGEFLALSASFASYQAPGTMVPVRSGPMTIAAGSYPNTSTVDEEPNAFGAPISFTTPYLYNPGESLVLFITHTGYTPATESQPFFAVTDYTPATTDAISSTAGYQATAPSGFSSPYIVQFTTATVPVPEPASMLMMAAGIAGLLFARRRAAAATAA